MASPQIEDGYTRFANELLEAIVKRPFSGRESSVIIFIGRMTYGYQGLKMREISLSEIHRGTGIARTHCSAVVASLVSKGVLLRTAPVPYTVTPSPAKLGINKDYDRWGVLPRTAPVPYTVTGGGAVHGNEGLPPTAPNKERTTKKELQKKTTLPPAGGGPQEFKEHTTQSEAEEYFRIFWEISSKKGSRKKALASWLKVLKFTLTELERDHKVKGHHQLYVKINWTMKAWMTTEDWTREKGEFAPHVVTWLNGHCWNNLLPAEVAARLKKPVPTSRIEDAPFQD